MDESSQYKNSKFVTPSKMSEEENFSSVKQPVQSTFLTVVKIKSSNVLIQKFQQNNPRTKKRLIS